MASSSSSTYVRQIKNDIFVSFRGSDTKHGFLSHLTRELRHKQIDVYGDERLERGDEISSALLKSIEASEISLIIFSKHYASSKWCLEELVKIMECKEANGQTVIPVFYNVDPSHVRHQQDTYGDAFAKHEQRFKDNMETLQIWRSALTKVANFSGYHYPSKFENECTLIDEIVKDVLDKLDDIYPIKPKCLVGFDGNFACVEERLEIGSQKVLILGIWGMGGVGKTTLALAIYKKFSSQFETCCFLENVREESKKINGLSYLHQKLVSKLLNQENIHIIDALKSSSIRRRLHRKKVLIVLDDVDTSKQLEYLVGEQLCLGPGSRAIVTSRDKHILISRRVDAIHDVKELNFEESLKLFSLNAFNQRYPEMGYEELSKRAVDYAKGIPLALKVLGSYFHSKNMETWESALKKLQKYPNMQIQNVLKVSYDGLDDVENDIFLDIAFFFKGEYKHEVIRVLDACGFYAASGIDSLLAKALITVSEYGEIQMHYLLQEMGEQLVREESIKNLGRRSRLNDVQEIYDVLKNNTGSDAIEGIILDVSQIKIVYLSVDAFKRMPKLRILKFHSGHWHHISNVNVSSGLEPFSNKLRYLYWDGYPLKSLPLHPENLVKLEIKRSKVRKLWDGVQDLVNLKTIKLKECHQLKELPDFSMAHNLEEVNLKACESLGSVHPSILNCNTLVSLYLYRCEEVESLQSECHLKSLQMLKVDSCYSLKEFSLSSKKLTRLNLGYTSIEKLDWSIGHCNNLEELTIEDSELKSLPIDELSCLTSLETFVLSYFRQVITKMELHNLFDGLQSLRYLHLLGCDKVAEIPDNISAFALLEELRLRDSSVENLPASIKHLSKLKKIWLTNCWRLRSIVGLPSFLEVLEAEGCISLETVCTFTTMAKTNWCCFSFRNCVKLDERSVCNIEKFTHRSMVAAMGDNGNLFNVCYPKSRVPKWIRPNQMAEAEASITIELTPFDQLLGFVCCCILFREIAPVICPSINCEFSVHSENHKFSSGYHANILPNSLNLGSAHVFLWKATYPYRLNNTLKLECQFSVRDYVGTRQHDGLIKACGVYPIYLSDHDNMVARRQRSVQTLNNSVQQRSRRNLRNSKVVCRFLQRT